MGVVNDLQTEQSSSYCRANHLTARTNVCCAKGSLTLLRDFSSFLLIRPNKYRFVAQAEILKSTGLYVFSD